MYSLHQLIRAVLGPSLRVFQACKRAKDLVRSVAGYPSLAPCGRTAAAYAVNLAAPLAKFAEAASSAWHVCFPCVALESLCEATPEACKRLAMVVGKPKPKKRAQALEGFIQPEGTVHVQERDLITASG